jgi:hypothetical protein
MGELFFLNKKTGIDMHKLFAIGLLTLSLNAHAQADHKLDTTTLRNDKTISHEIIHPILDNARAQNQEPDWNMLRTAITSRFDTSYANRDVTKAKIFFFYGRDWAQFSTALVQYTNTYEWRDSLSLMDANAKMILDHSTNPSDLKAAQSWAKYASGKNPSSDQYKATYDALTAKINGQ